MRFVHALLMLASGCGLVLAQPAPPPGSPPGPPPGVDEQPRTVRVWAEGYNRDDALKQALRKALEEGAGVQIAAYSEVQNFALMRDTIYSRASGLVSDYRILREGRADDGAFRVEIEARVRPSTIAAAWGEVQNVLDQVGRPKIMIWIDERIDGQLQPDSIVQGRIEELFIKSGFDLVDRKATEELRQREARDAEDEQNAAKLARLAKEAGAHVLIRGSANADRAGVRDIYGSPAAFYNCAAQARIYWTDTARLLASESVPVRERGVRSHREYSPQAARAALVAATLPEPGRERPGESPPLAVRLLDSVMEQWSVQLSAGGDIELEVEKIDFRTFMDIRRALQAIEGLRSVDGDFTTGTGSFRIKAQISAVTLGEHLTAKPFSDWLEVTDFKTNRIQARAVGRP